MQNSSKCSKESKESNPIVDVKDACKWKTAKTEYFENFLEPVHREEKISRKSNMNAFLWRELSLAVIEGEREREKIEKNQKHDSEYVREFHLIPLDHSKEDDAVQKAYPLYGTEAISYWCPSVKTKTPFKQSHSMTKPNDVCYDCQFR